MRIIRNGGQWRGSFSFCDATRWRVYSAKCFGQVLLAAKLEIAREGCFDVICGNGIESMNVCETDSVLGVVLHAVACCAGH